LFLAYGFHSLNQLIRSHNFFKKLGNTNDLNLIEISKEVKNRKIMYYAENFSPKTPIYHKFITKSKGISLY